MTYEKIRKHKYWWFIFIPVVNCWYITYHTIQLWREARRKTE